MIMWWCLAVALLIAGRYTVSALWLLAGCLLLACRQQVLHIPGVAALAVLALLAWLHRRYPMQRWLAVSSEILLVGAAIGLMFHLIPGFSNLKIITLQRLGTLSGPPFTFYFNLDKALIPFVLLACVPRLMQQPRTIHHSWWQWGALILAMPVLLISAVMLGGLAIEPHFPAWLGTFMLANLFFVSLAEEALFRGWLQQRLSQWLGYPAGWLISSLLFGLVHFPAGLLFMAFATLAGLIYGLAWWWSGRLWVATGVHFVLNIMHLLFFTYPMLQH